MYRILIVDDEPFVLESLKATIPWASKDCVVVGSASNGMDALQMLSKVRPDIVMTDIRMPRMDGLELTRRIHELHPDLPVIIITGHADFEYARSALVAGAIGYCLKPFDEAEILPVLQRACERRAINKATITEEAEIVLPQLEAAGFLPGKLRPVHVLVINSPHAINPPGLWDYHCKRLDSLTRAYLLRNMAPSSLSKWAKANMAGDRRGWALAENITDAATLEKVVFETRIKAYDWFMRGGDKQRYSGNPDPEFLKILTSQLIKDLQDGEISYALQRCSDLIQAFTKENYTIQHLRTSLITLHSFLDTMIPGLPDNESSFEHDSIVSHYDSPGQALQVVRRRIEGHGTSILQAGVKRDGKDAIAEIMAYLRNNFRRDISLDGIAEACGLSRRSISAVFKKETGHNVMVFRNQLRIEQAIRLLKETNYSLEEISERLGFSSSFYFSRVFKNFTGIAPAHFRNKPDPEYFSQRRLF